MFPVFLNPKIADLHRPVTTIHSAPPLIKNKLMYNIRSVAKITYIYIYIYYYTKYTILLLYEFIQFELNEKNYKFFAVKDQTFFFLHPKNIPFPPSLIPSKRLTVSFSSSSFRLTVCFFRLSQKVCM